jgi:hypothetical protein
MRHRYRPMALFPYRLIDTSGSEIGIVKQERSEIAEGDTVRLARWHVGDSGGDLRDEFGQEGASRRRSSWRRIDPDRRATPAPHFLTNGSHRAAWQSSDS